MSLINPAETSRASLPPIAAKPVVPFNAFLAVEVRVIAIVEAFAAVTVSISLNWNVLSAVVEPSPFISQTNFDQSR